MATISQLNEVYHVFSAHDNIFREVRLFLSLKVKYLKRFME